MIFMQWIAFIVIIALIVSHGIWPASFILDKFSMVLVFLLAIPLIAPFLKKAKGFGVEFEFRKEIEKAYKLVQKSAEQAKQKKTQLHYPREAVWTTFETFSTQNAHQYLETDPNLALASLRMEIERVIKFAVKKLVNGDVQSKTLRQSIKVLLGENFITSDQAKAFDSILNMCNKAIHGAELSKDEAKEIISLTERLNISFSHGYSLNINPNKSCEDQNYVCEWEHCIELFPLTEESTNLSCPLFGHNCPGGLESKSMCNIKNEDFAPKEAQ